MTKKTHGRAHEISAKTRFMVIGHLLVSPPKKGELKQAIAELAARTWQHPENGTPMRFSFSTIERWYYTAKREKDDELRALKRKRRSDAGCTIMSLQMGEVLTGMYNSDPDFSVKLHYDNLVAYVKKHPELGEVPSYKTVLRFFRSNGLIKRRPLTNRTTAGALAAIDRLESREVRSYELDHVNALWHWDFHHGSRKVLTSTGEWATPVVLGILDDRSRVVCHMQWYLNETTENVVHSMKQAIMKRGMPRAAMSDNGSAMIACEITEGLERLAILHKTTLPYSPYQNGKQESFWKTLETRLLAMVKSTEEEPLTLAKLNDVTQAWVQFDYNNKVHSSLGCTPVERFLEGPSVTRPSPTAAALKFAFTRAEMRKVRRSDGTITISAQRFEVPNCYRHLAKLEVRYATWDLSFVYLIDEQTGEKLCRLYPQDKSANARGVRRSLEPSAIEPVPRPKGEEAPLLKSLLEQAAETGLPPAYLVKDEDK